MSINDRIQQLINSLENGNQKAFSDKIGIAPSSLNGVVGARHSDPPTKMLYNILTTYADVNSSWLITGKGEMLIKNDQLQTIENNISDNEDNNKNTIEIIREFSAIIREISEENALLKAELKKIQGKKGNKYPKTFSQL